MLTIISPTDFSETSLNAVNYAADMARHTGARLLLLHVYAVPVLPAEVPVPPEVYDDLQQTMEKRISRLAEDIRLRTENKTEVNTLVLQGSIDYELAVLCKETDPFAVVMGMKSSSAAKRFLFGSTVLHAVRHLHCPVISVPPGAVYKKTEKIGLACDMRHMIETGNYQAIEKILSVFGATLHIIHAVKDKREVGADVVSGSVNLQSHFYQFHPVFHYPEEINIEQGINDFAKKEGLDMLIVIPQKHSLLETFLYKEHTKEFILHQQLPVLTIRA